MEWRLPVRRQSQGLALVLMLLAATGHAKSQLTVVPDVNPENYAGRWYEIALIPHWFERGCSDTTATYSLRADGRIDVLNRCLRQGKPHQARAVAWHAGEGRDGKFKVRFFWPFSGHYWVLALDRDYQWAVVGHPSRRYFWILSRRPTLDPATYDRLMKQAAALGFDPARIQRTVHSKRVSGSHDEDERSSWNDAPAPPCGLGKRPSNEAAEQGQDG